MMFNSAGRSKSVFMHYQSIRKKMAGRILLLAALQLAGIPANGAEKAPLRYENEQLHLRLMPRSNEQMAAFFEARGFPPAMREALLEYCFFTVVIKNKMPHTLKLNLTNWRFTAKDETVQRIPRDHWPPVWRELQIPKSAQATFRWTLLPEHLDFFAGESEGGNIILAKTLAPFDLQARFTTGKGAALVARVNDLRCAGNGGQGQ